MLLKTLLTSAILIAFTSHAAGKGLDELSDQNPENPQPVEPTAETELPQSTEEPVVEPKAEEAMVDAQKPSPRPLQDKLFLATSAGWVKASLPEGEWTSSGMADFSVGYLVHEAGFQLFSTYRYAPAAAAGDVEDRAYRVVLESHNFGVLGAWKLSDTMKALGSFEAGVLITGVEALDEAEPESSHVKSGGVATIGGGADWRLMEKFDLGPRLYASFGSATMIQFGAQAGFFF